MSNSPNTSAPADTTRARRAMIDSQLRTSGVNEEYVLARLMAVPRENYVPADKASLAYIDRSIALGDDTHLASPLFYGKVLSEAAPRASDSVLVVEGGTGYLAELLAPLVGSVAKVSASDASAGNLPDGPFTLVVIDGAIEHLPESMSDALADDGRIVSGLLLRGVTRLAAGRKAAGSIALEPVEDIGIPVIAAFNRKKEWTFS